MGSVDSGYAWTRNPIVLRADFSPASDPAGGSLSISLGAEKVYEGKFSNPLELDVSEIIDARVPYLPDAGDWSGEALIPITEDPGDLSDMTALCVADYGGAQAEWEFLALPGGISRQAFREFSAGNTDVFAKRFLSLSCNFFLTVRSASSLMSIKETELCPLYFLVNRERDFLAVKASVGGSIVFSNLQPGVYALDLNELRRRFVEEHDVLPSVFSVYKGVDTLACRIVIEKAEASKERYVVKFRNSLGVFEAIEMVGALWENPEFEEGAVFSRADSVAGGFVRGRERIEMARSLSLSTGFKNPSEAMLLMDMVASEEAYLLGWRDWPVKVIPSMEDASVRARPDVPQSFVVKLDIADSDSNILHGI
ncbi:MAG: hypothetical protein NC102_00265 [Clostridium sp.]|nr:hypothetical protein [Clostridium sp.]